MVALVLFVFAQQADPIGRYRPEAVTTYLAEAKQGSVNLFI